MKSRRFVMVLAVVVGGCAHSAPRLAVPEHLASVAQPAGFNQVRVWGDQGGSQLNAIIANERALALRRGPATVVALEQHFLALSGGADDGAFGAGLLNGWSLRGTRPSFQVVTGISAGALIAPFAFLGSGYDAALKEIYTTYGGEDIYQTQVLQGLLGGAALASNQPLADLIARYIDKRFMRLLAIERAKGRALFIGTTNIDMQRPVFWDIGRIAQSGHPAALTLIRDILLASSALPGLFPPVRIKVEFGAEVFEELHVDGGPTRQVFIGPADLSFRAFDQSLGRKTNRTLWVVRNSKVVPEYSAVKETALAISQRALETLTKYQGLGDLTRMYGFAKREGMTFRLASIPADFDAPRSQPFDRAYMSALFARGVDYGKDGSLWASSPP